MRQLGLVSKIRRKKYNSYRGTTSRIADNVLDRNFEQSAPNKAWVSDVTEFRVAGTKVYLSPIMDLFDRTILAHTLSTSPNTQFTSGSLADAIAMFSPGEGLIVHTDQGFQYQHTSWRDLMTSIGGVQSMSRKGNCYDNKVMENFFGHLKSEMYHGVSFSSVEEFCHAVDDYILWYNSTRLQEQFKGLPRCNIGTRPLQRPKPFRINPVRKTGSSSTQHPRMVLSCFISDCYISKPRCSRSLSSHRSSALAFITLKE
ncbi:hypothetical protein CIP107517_00036 [Corynebacterium diphtheriae]|nr:hypothetical protein CIP107517_00036 [Corynebacterium diphtheriae]CAB0924014.1 hypothetical protein FRC0433_00056 [Corynebacterium diphtheriae]